MFVLRFEDIEPGILRIDEALKETEKGIDLRRSEMPVKG